MIRVGVLLIPVFLITYTRIVYDILVKTLWLTSTQRDVIYFVCENLFVGWILVLIIMHTSRRIEKIISITFLFVIIGNILLFLYCWRMDYDSFRVIASNTTIDIIKWVTYALITIIGVKWGLSSKLTNYG